MNEQNVTLNEKEQTNDPQVGQIDLSEIIAELRLS